MQVTIKYLTNGYSVTGIGDAVNPILAHYAVDLNEAVYWIAQFFGVPGGVLMEAPPVAQPYAQAVNNPMISQEANVYALSGGGYITRAQPNRRYGTPIVEEFCVDMDGVHAALTKIYTYVPAPVT